MKLPLYPKLEQARLFDMWRGRCRSLWNLLLRMQMDAYSGEDHHPEFGWRSIWADVLAEFYARDLDAWTNGKTRRDGSVRKAAGAGKEPVAPDPAVLAKILNTVPRDKDGKLPESAEEPKLFIWERELNALMARLKRVPRVAWIADIPSHAAQHVVKDLIKAIQTMLRERKKRLGGTGDRMAGFPRFKPNRYAEGSVYFANTQLKWDTQRKRVLFPNGGGWVRYEGGDGLTVASKFAATAVNEEGDRLPKSESDGAKLMGARLWRQGEKWWLSPQFEMPVPAAPRFNGRQVGVKVAAGTLATVYDGKRFQEFAAPKEDPRAQRRLRQWGRKLIRRREAQAAKAATIARRDGLAGGVRLRRSKGFYAASAELARRHAREANQRNHTVHWVSHVIATHADHITLESMDVAGMMERPSKRARRRQRRQERLRATNGAATPISEPNEQERIEHKAPHRVLRKAMRRAAVARLLTYIKYKAHDAAREVTETHELFPRVQECAGCQALHPVMKDGRALLRCPDCGGAMRRHLNAAENIYESGKASRESGLEAAE
jgi:transposase